MTSYGGAAYAVASVNIIAWASRPWRPGMSLHVFDPHVWLGKCDSVWLVDGSGRRLLHERSPVGGNGDSGDGDGSDAGFVVW